MNATDRVAELTGRSIFDAAISGKRRPWRLPFTLDFAEWDDAWRSTRAMLNVLTTAPR